MYTLSGGQKSRVAFAKVTFSKPHILLLDEPSNHLDLDAVNALIQVSCGPAPLCSAQLWPCPTLQCTAVALSHSAVHSCGPVPL